MIYFNPRLREGGDRLLRPILTQIQISIHASAKEATNSNHFALKLDNYFNPRLREGGDYHVLWQDTHEAISIHASAKEATKMLDKVIGDRFGFQSTPPRRRRPYGFDNKQGEMDFNPRLREGGDTISCRSRFSCIISIHASAKEATGNVIEIPDESMISIHASAKEATHMVIKGARTIAISIHASAKEATRQARQVGLVLFISIHASAKEATATYCDTSAIMYISSLNNFFVHYF